MYALPSPGNVWNGRTEISYEEITREDVISTLLPMIVGKNKYYTDAEGEGMFTKQESMNLVNDFLDNLSKREGRFKILNIRPNFLNLVEDCHSFEYAYSGDYVKVGYFEGYGKDLAIAFLKDGYMYILLTSGY